MNIILVITKRHDSILHISKSLRLLGHTVHIIWSDDYTNQVSYFYKKLDDWGFRRGRKSYERARQEKLLKLANADADMVLWINSPAILPLQLFKELSKAVKQVAWFVDSIHGAEELVPYFPYLAKSCVFEKSDVQYLKGLNVDNGTYCPIGYNEDYANVLPQTLQNDIVFIGSPFRYRLKVLNKIAEAADRKHWKLAIYGPFWEDMYFWKRWVFRFKYPKLYPYIINGNVTSAQAAKIYASAKIALNIHASQHKSPNPRTFEIIASGALELCDARENYVGEICPPKALAVFTDDTEMLNKLEYYLVHEDERVAISKYAKEHNIYSMSYSLKHILDNDND